MYSNDTLLALIPHIYDAALDPAQWPIFLNLLAETIHGTATNLLHHSVDSPSGFISLGVRVDPSLAASYNAYYGRVDPWIAGAKRQRLLHSGSVQVGEQLVPNADFIKTEFFNDYAKALDAMHCLGATIIQEGSIVSSLSVLRPEKSGPFEDAEAKLMHALMPHLQRALRMHHRLTSLEVRNQANAEILDRLPAGVLLLGPDGLVLFVNRAAQAIIESRDGLTIERTGLAGATPRETSRLRTVIARASASARGAWDDSGGAVRLPRPSGRRDLALVVTPLAAGNRLNPGIAGATVAAFVSDPEHSPVANEDHLRRLYGLTRAESALAARLASGLTLQEASEHLAVSKNTVRWHLKSVFAKTATRNQSDLMRLILSGPGTLPPT